MFVNFDDVEKIKDAIESVHGSGINYDYDFKIGYSKYDKKGRVMIKAYNKYDEMDDAGFYTGNIEFVVIVPVDNPEDYEIQLPSECEDLKEYLDECYADVLINRRY